MSSKTKNCLGFCFASLLIACVPDVYLIDKQTVLETQASGQWPELDRIFYEQAVSAGPAPLEKTANRQDSRQLFQMTHSDHPVDTKSNEARR